MMEQVTDFIKQQTGKREILVWGAWEEGYKISVYLKENGINISGFIDSNKPDIYYCGYKVYNTSIICKENTSKYYLVISLADHESVYNMLYDNKYTEFKDYLYFGKSIFLSSITSYKDIYGNSIYYMARNGKKKFLESLNIEMSAASVLIIEDGVQFGQNVKIKATHFSKIWIKKGTKISDNTIIEAHRGCEIIIEQGCVLGHNISFVTLLHGKILIGAKTTFNHNVDIRVSDHSVFECGSDCMFSYDIKVRGSDGHTLIDKKNKKLMDRKKNVYIGKHVWIGTGVTLFPGTIIEEDVVIGANSFVNSQFPSGCVILGTPARIYKEDVTWDRSFDITYKEWEKKNL